ncbi:NADP-dependent oxidoreductase [Pseudonocardia sp. NPDC049154]|uniref:NADP-dependent oxidoreductase n=1 Tax=Pseudonocardia sp. NPDC049154 TaxID=3155501 RepID=UPI0033E70D28
MRAVVVTRPGGPEVLEVRELPEPEAGGGQVRIRVAAAVVNPTDTMFRTRGPDETDDAPGPWIPGMELAGRVDAVGPGSRFRVGDRVMAVTTPRRPEGGAQAELVVVPEGGVTAVPERLSDAEAAGIPMNGLTALGAVDHLGLEAGGTIGVTGAAGAVGGYVVEIAKARGLRVLADAAPADEELVRGLGADVVVPRGPDVAKHFLDATDGAGVDGLVDGAVLDAAALPAVRNGGTLVTVRFWAAPAERGVRVVPVLVRRMLEDTAGLETLAGMAVEGTLTPRVARIAPLRDVVEVHRTLERGGTRGRLVLDLTEDGSDA